MNRQITTVRQILQAICSGVYAEQTREGPQIKCRITIDPITCIENTQMGRVENFFSEYLHISSILFS